MTDTPWMTTEEAGEYARCSAKAIRDHLEAGRLGGHKRGRRWLVHRDDLDAWMRSGRIEMRVLRGRSAA